MGEAYLVACARHSQALVTINDHLSRYALLKRVASKKAPITRWASVTKIRPFARLAHTLTTDNGKEFAQHERIAAALKLNCYFAHPYAAWECVAN